ncbi:MAG: acyltransferase family protein [Candidatus Magnetomorum sp.]|nr:acyltransferase family protein [Candidatus Magnetomorum sp.]
MINGYGFDKTSHDLIMKVLDFLANYYWRMDIEGIENIPENGGAMIVMNHAGTIALDVLMIKQAIYRRTINNRIAWATMADFLTWTPFVGDIYWRAGSVLATWDNAKRLLNDDQIIIVCPEGTRGVGKHFTRRYQLGSFGTGGFARLATQTNKPVIPTSVVGSEEIYPVVYKNKKLGKFLGFPFFPITFTFPLLGPLGAIPLPSKWKIKFDIPIYPEDYQKKGTLEEKALEQQTRFIETLYPCDEKKKLIDMPPREKAIANDVVKSIKRNINLLLKKRKNVFF